MMMTTMTSTAKAMPTSASTGAATTVAVAVAAASTTGVVATLQLIGDIILPVFFALGVVGNLLTVHVMFTARFRRLAVSRLLVALALSDFVVSIGFPLNKLSVRRLFRTDLRALSTIGCHIFYWTHRAAETASAWLVVLISCERFVAVWLPLRAKVISTPSHALAAVAVVYAACAAYMAYVTVVDDALVGGVCVSNYPAATTTGQTEQHVNAYVIICVSAAVPAALLLVLNAFICWRLYSLERDRRRRRGAVPGFPSSSGNGGGDTGTRIASMPTTTTRAASDDQSWKTTVTLVLVTFAFVAFIGPWNAVNFAALRRGVALPTTTDPSLSVVRELTQMLEQVNYAANFLFYVVFSSVFRRRLVELFRVPKIVPIRQIFRREVVEHRAVNNVMELESVQL